MTRSSSSATEGNTRAPARRGAHHAHPAQLILIGAVLFLFSLVIVTLQTQTSQDYVNHRPQKDEQITTEVSLWLWLRVPKVVGGDAVPGPAVEANDLPGIIVSQMAEFVYIAVLWGAGIVYATTRGLGKVFGTIALILLGIICILDFTSDLSYGNYATDTHIMFAVTMTFAVGFLPTLGIALMSEGWKRL